MDSVVAVFPHQLVQRPQMGGVSFGGFRQMEDPAARRFHLALVSAHIITVDHIVKSEFLPVGIETDVPADFLRTADGQLRGYDQYSFQTKSPYLSHSGVYPLLRRLIQ